VLFKGFKMTKLILSIFIIAVLIFSCKEEDSQNPVIVGDKGLNMNFHEISPPFKLELKYDSVKKNAISSDSMDIGLDGKFDLFISQRISIDSTIKYFSYENYPYCRLTFKNGLEVATKKELYHVGHGDLQDVTWVDTLDIGNRIDNLCEWSVSHNNNSLMWAIAPIPYAVSHGCWFNLSIPDKYIGIRIKYGSKYKLGWIKVNQISRDKMSIVSYAIEK
jgi:hypothetical protein